MCLNHVSLENLKGTLPWSTGINLTLDTTKIHKKGCLNKKVVGSNMSMPTCAKLNMVSTNMLQIQKYGNFAIKTLNVCAIGLEKQ